MQDTRIIGIDYSKDQGLNSYKGKVATKKTVKTDEKKVWRGVSRETDNSDTRHYCKFTFLQHYFCDSCPRTPSQGHELCNIFMNNFKKWSSHHSVLAAKYITLFWYKPSDQLHLSCRFDKAWRSKYVCEFTP